MVTATPPPGTSQANDNEIDLGQVVGALRRRWKILVGVAGGTVLLAGLFTLIQKPTWEGEFQIVLADKEESSGKAVSILAQNPSLAALVGAGGNSSDRLETEVKILESPSVLKPVFDFVRTTKINSGEKVDDLRFAEWRKKNLDIKLEKGTSVLNLSYRDKDQSLILPVIERISKAYQAYSGRDRKQGLARAVDYLDQQIKIYKARALSSLKAAQQYAIEQDLTALRSDDETVNNLNLDAVRVQAANEIRNYDQQLRQLSKLGNDSEAIQFKGLTIPELAGKGLPQQIESINVQLAFLRQTFTDKEPQIKNLVERRQLLIDVFKRNTISYLLAKRADAQARLAAAQRPKGVLIRYRQLLRVASRDDAIFNKLDDDRRGVALEKARRTDPWELISTPTLLDKPVAPRKVRNLALGLLAGLVLGSGAALVVDRRSGRVFSREELQQLLPYPLLADLDSHTPETWDASLQLLATGPLQGAHTVALVPIGDAPVHETSIALAEALQTVLQQLNPQGPSPLVSASSDLVAARQADRQLLITATGATSREQLAHWRQQLDLQGKPVAGLILLAPSPLADG